MSVILFVRLHLQILFHSYSYKLYFMVFGNIKIERRVDQIGIRAELIKRGTQKLRGMFNK
jgi:hypothetical protein